MRDTIPALSRPEVKGHAKVQLFDGETGALDHQQEVDNFVSPRMLRAIGSMMNQSLFGIGSSTTTRETPTKDASILANTVFGGLVLTTNSAPVNPEAERVVIGKTIGVGSYLSAPAGLYRASYNVLESEHRFGYHKFVYDFATNQALGTFQSVYTGPYDIWSTDSPFFNGQGSYNLMRNTSYTGRGNPFRDHATGDIYMQYSQSSIRFQTTQNLLDYLYMTGIPTTFPVVPLAVQLGGFVAIRQGYMYSVYQGNSIWRAPLDNLSVATKVVDLNVAWRTANLGSRSSDYALYNIIYNSVTDQFLLSVGSPDAFVGNRTIAVVLNPQNAAWPVVDTLTHPTLASMYNIALYPGETGWSGSVLMGQMALINSSYGYSFWVDPVTNVVSERGKSATYRTDGLVCVLPGNDLAFSASTNNVNSSPYVGIAPAQDFFSRALLEEPVTKLSTQSMKITYEFIMPTI